MTEKDSLRVMAMYDMMRKIKENQETKIRELMAKVDALESELSEYRQMAASYGIDAKTMCALAKSQIKTCADNIRLREELEERRGFARDVVKFIATCSSPDPFMMKIIDHCRELAEVDGEL